MKSLFKNPIDPENLVTEFKGVQDLFSLARILETDFRHLNYILYKKIDEYYKEFEIQKKSKSLRVIRAPQSGLKVVQTKLAYILQLVYETKSSVHGFVPDRSIKTNAQKHIR